MMAIPRTRIFLDGVAVTDIVSFISITIQQRVDLIDKAEIIVPEDLNQAVPFSVFNSDQFKEGKQISIYAGYDDSDTSIFTGIIASQTIACDERGNATLTIACNGTSPVVSNPAYLPHSVSFAAAQKLESTLGVDILSCSLQVKAEPASGQLDWLCGHVTMSGSAETSINTMVRLNNFGPRISADAYIAGVKHVIAAGGWVTTLELGRSTTPA